ncbi:MAG TPA: NifU family protein [Solirubrobacteraceae bacterium]|jgi:Fe-S cluster biogenesis protein NfuA/nitrite reductase/ring-hydroxylating ferredoxin subunit
MATETQPGALLDRVQDLTGKVDELPDPRARQLAQELVATVIAMYGDGLERIMAVIGESREAGATIIDQLTQDGAVASLLLIHDLYPVSLHDRVMEALDTIRPYMESHGGNVELVALEEGVATLALQGSCNGCAASRATLELAIKQALDEHAPDLAGLEVQGVTEPVTPPGDSGSGIALPMASPAEPTGLELPIVHAGPELPVADERPPRWVPVADSARPQAGGLRSLTVDGIPLLLAEVSGALLAYADECASCGEPLGSAALDGPMLRCAACQVEFDLPRAGRAAGGEPLQLRPVPLLEAGGLRVAV